MEKIIKRLFFFNVFFIGAATLVLEIAGARIISPFFGSTIFVWSSLITATLGGLAAGYIIGSSICHRSEKEDSWFYGLTTALGCLLIFTPLAVLPFAGFAEQLGLRFGPLLASALLFFPSFILIGVTTPLGVKIYSKDKSAGRAAGHLYALGTLGSLLAALLIGFFLIPVLPLSQMFYGSGAILILGSLPGARLFLKRPGLKNSIGLFFSLLIIFLLTASAERNIPGGSWAKIVDSATTFYSGLKVIEFSDLRCILGGLKLYSCINVKSGESTSDFSVLRDGLNPFVESLRPGNSALLLGGGSGMAFEKLPAGVSGTIVELDPIVVKLAEKYLRLDSSRLNIIVDDARHALKTFASGKTKFDLVIMDVIADTKIPAYIMSKEAFGEFASALNENGLLIIHGGISPEKPAPDDKYLGAILKTAEGVFPYEKATWRNDGNSRNIVLYFSKNPIPETKIPEIPIVKGSVVLTDDFNPLDYYNLDRQLALTNELRGMFQQIALK